MPRELETICTDLDDVLLNTLAQWRRDLENPEDGADQLSLYCLYPKLASQISWARGTLAQVEGTMDALRLRENMGAYPATGGGVAGGCCCPCCGSSGGQMPGVGQVREASGCSCRQDPGRGVPRERFPETEEVSIEAEVETSRDDGEVTETRVYEETIIEESRNGRRKQGSRTGRSR